MEFQKVFFQPVNTKPILDTPPRERLGIIRSILKRLQLHRMICGITIIPGPIIQLVCPAEAASAIRQALIDANMKIPTDPNPIATHPKSKMAPEEADRMTANRLASLCMQSRSRNFQETVLEGIPEALRLHVLHAYRAFTKQEEALLGHEGRPYSEGIMHVDSEQ